MARKSTNKPALIGRVHKVPTVKPTFEDLDNLDEAELREYVKENAGVDGPTLTREALLKIVCMLKKIHRPDDEIPGPVRKPSLFISSSVSRQAEINGATSVVQPPVGDTTAPTSSALPKYPANRANRLDTRRLPPPPDDSDEDNFDPEGLNCPAPNSTPEPDEPLAQVPPADAESLEQTVKILQAFRKRKEDLEKHVKKITDTAQALKTAADLIQSVVAQRTTCMRMEQYLNYYTQEQPTFSHEVVFPPPTEPANVSVDEETQTIMDEMDAIDEDRREDFATFKASVILQHAQKAKKPDPKRYLNHDNASDKLNPNKAFYWPETSRGLSETEKEAFAGSRFIRGNPDARRRLYAAIPELKPKNLKRPASFHDENPSQEANKRPRPLSRQRIMHGGETKSMSMQEELVQQPELRTEGSRTSPSAPVPAPGNSEVSMMSPADSESWLPRSQVSYTPLLLVRPLQRHPRQQNGVAPSASKPRRGLRRHETLLLDGKLL